MSSHRLSQWSSEILEIGGTSQTWLTAHGGRTFQWTIVRGRWGGVGTISENYTVVGLPVGKRCRGKYLEKPGNVWTLKVSRFDRTFIAQFHCRFQKWRQKVQLPPSATSFHGPQGGRGSAFLKIIKRYWEEVLSTPPYLESLVIPRPPTSPLSK